MSRHCTKNLVGAICLSLVLFVAAACGDSSTPSEEQHSKQAEAKQEQLPNISPSSGVVEEAEFLEAAEKLGYASDTLVISMVNSDGNHQGFFIAGEDCSIRMTYDGESMILEKMHIYSEIIDIDDRPAPDINTDAGAEAISDLCNSM